MNQPTDHIPGQLQLEFDVPIEVNHPPLMTGLQGCVISGEDYYWMGLLAPRDAWGNCKECGIHFSKGNHLGTCSKSYFQSGIVQ